METLPPCESCPGLERLFFGGNKLDGSPGAPFPLATRPAAEPDVSDYVKNRICCKGLHAKSGNRLQFRHDGLDVFHQDAFGNLNVERGTGFLYPR